MADQTYVSFQLSSGQDPQTAYLPMLCALALGSHMNDEAPAGGKTDAPEALAASNLVALSTTVTTMQRFMARRNADGGLVPAEAAMIQLAVESARVEVRAVSERLNKRLDDPTSAQGIAVVTLLKAIADIEVVLDVLADAVGRVRA